MFSYYSARDRKGNGFFAPVVPVIQSSGFGKTRSMLELGKYLPVFYLQCRPLPHFRFKHNLAIKSEAQAFRILRGCEKFLSDWIQKRINGGQAIPSRGEWAAFSDLFNPLVTPISSLSQTWNDISALVPEEKLPVGSSQPRAHAEICSSYENVLRIDGTPKFLVVLDEAIGLVKGDDDFDPLSLRSPFRLIRSASRLFGNGTMAIAILDTNSKFSNFLPVDEYDPSLKLDNGLYSDVPIPIMALDTLDIGLMALYEEFVLHLVTDDFFEWRLKKKKEIVCLGRILWKSHFEGLVARGSSLPFDDLLRFAKLKLGLVGKEHSRFSEESNLAALVSLCPAFLTGRKLADHFVSRNMGVIHGCTKDRSEIQVSFHPEHILAAASWSYFEEDIGRLHYAIDTLIRFTGNGFTNLGDSGEFAGMLLFLLACRTIGPEQDPHSFNLITLEAFLSRLFLRQVQLPADFDDCHLGFNAFYSLDIFADGLSTTLGDISLLRGIGIKLEDNFPAIDVIIPM